MTGAFSLNRDGGFTKILVIIFAIVLFIIVAFCVYFFVWRPSDDAYKTASGNVQQMTAAAKITSADLTDLHVYEGLLDTSVSKPLSTNITAFNTAFTSLQTSPVVKYDPVVKQLYESHRNALNDYGSFVHNFGTSIALVQGVVTACEDMADTLASGTITKDFYTNATKCQNEIQALHASESNSVFEKQFIEDLVNGETDKLNAYANWVATALKGTSGLSTANKLITAAQTEVHNTLYSKVAYTKTPPQNPAAILQNLLTTIDSQQKQFFR